jgi:plastocyanin
LTRNRVAALGFVALSVLSAAYPASAARTPKVTMVRVEAGAPGEYVFVLTPKTAKRGIVTFVVVNGGEKPHDFKIAGRRTRVLGPGETAQLTLTFAKAGRYAYFCTVAGHAVAGMKGSFRVT